MVPTWLFLAWLAAMLGALAWAILAGLHDLQRQERARQDEGNTL